MRYIDISVPLGPDLPAYPGEPSPRLWPAGAGPDFYVTGLEIRSHSGTHIDAPAHIRPGAPGADAFAFEAMNGPAVVVDATQIDQTIDSVALSGLRIPDGATRLLFKTQNSTLWSRGESVNSFVALDAGAAEHLVRLGVLLVGIDYLSISPFDDPLPTHRVLLEAGVVILEGLDLSGVDPGDYRLLCLPLLLPGCDGAPCRAVLVEGED